LIINFLSLIYTEEYNNKHSKHDNYIQYAADSFQKNILNGLSRNLECEKVNLINFYPVASFPFKNRMIFYRKITSEKNGISFNDLPFINIPIIKQLSRFIVLYKYINKSYKSNNLFHPVLVYDSYLPYLFALKFNRYLKNVRKIVIVTDLPNKFGIKKNDPLIFKPLRAIEGYLKLKLLRQFDKYILLTSHMSEILNLSNDKYIVVEGLFDIQKVVHKSIMSLSNKKVILYTGTVNKQFGMTLLIELANKLDDSFLVCVLGNGDYVGKIKAVSKTHNILYLGEMSQDDIIEMQKQAYILVNPRPNDDLFTKYSFPSKIMEYLFSGKPVVCMKLDGIPSDYDRHLNYYQFNSVESIFYLIKKIDKNYQKFLNKAKVAREYIRKFKNLNYQTSKIIELFKEIDIND